MSLISVLTLTCGEGHQLSTSGTHTEFNSQLQKLDSNMELKLQFWIFDSKKVAIYLLSSLV